MMLLKKQVNIHKVISNLKCTVEDGSLSVSFHNTAIGTIIALKLTLKGLNNTSKSVTINGQKSFPVMISNILVAPNQKASKLKAELPSTEISKVEVQQIQVIYQENSRILDVPEQKMVEYNINILDDFSEEEINGITEHDELMCLKEKNKMFICYPTSHAMGWICACGNLNGKTIEKCINCGEEYSTVKKYTRENIIKECIAAKPKQEAQPSETPAEQEASKPKTEAPVKQKPAPPVKREEQKPEEKPVTEPEPQERRHVNNELDPAEKKRIIITAALISAGFIALVTVLLILVL